MPQSDFFSRRGWSWIAVILSTACFLSLSGCPSNEDKPALPSTSPAAEVIPLRLVVIDDPGLAEVVERDWKARQDGDFEVSQMSSSELAEASELAADAVIYPSGMLGEMVSRGFIAEIPDNVLTGPQLDRRDILQLSRLREVSWGRKVYAFPLGSPQLTLYYRADLFKQLKLQPPTTWPEYQQLAHRLAQRQQLGELAPPEDQPWWGAVEPLAPQWASQVLLARAAAYARERGRYSTMFDYNTMKPMIDSPAFVRALEELVAVAKPIADEAIGWNPHDARREFYAGHCAMALSWPSRAGGEADSDVTIGGASALAELPGSDEVYRTSSDVWEARETGNDPHVPLLAVSGRMASVTAESPNPRGALMLLLWMVDKDRGGEIASYSSATTMFRTSQFSSTRQWVEPALSRNAARQYSEVVRNTQKRSAWLFSLRIAGRQQYLSALDEAVHQAVAGDTEPAAALRDASVKWEGITDKLGRQRQGEAYQRSLGLEP